MCAGLLIIRVESLTLAAATSWCLYNNSSSNPEYTFFSSMNGTLSWINYILRHKTSLNKLKKIEIMSKHFFWLQQHETGNQPQKEKKWERKEEWTLTICCEKLIGQWQKSKEELEMLADEPKWKLQHHEVDKMWPTQVWERKFMVI